MRFIYLYISGVSVCVSVCLFGFGGQTTLWIQTKFGINLPLVPLGDLKKDFLWGEILEKLKIAPFAVPSAAPFVQI